MKHKIEDLFQDLYNSSDESEVIKNLKIIIKSYSTYLYKQKLLQNPYFSLLINDIKSDILLEINLLKHSIEKEIKSIDHTLSNPITVEDFNKLKILKRECLGLLYEINDKINDLILL